MLQKTFLHAALWNAFNVFLYKIILQTHQACLFYVISKELFGISGTLFSIIYFLINLTNFGFDYSLFAFHSYFSSCQSNFKKMIYYFKLRSFMVLMITLFILMFCHFFSYLPQISFIKQFTSPSLIILLACIFISESIKKSFELFAHLSFLNKSVTIVEIASLLIYSAMVWSYYFLFRSINLYVIFSAMCIMSYLELYAILQRLKTFEKTLPSTCPNQLFPTQKMILKNQAINYINQITKALFSPNFMIIVLAYRLGMVKAGYIKLIIDIIILMYMLLNRAVGIPSGALMSRSTIAQKSISDQITHPSKIFLKITNAYIQFLYALFMMCSAIIVPCLLKLNCSDTTIIINILLFSFAGFLEYLMITYEKLYITQNAEKKLAMINIIGLGSVIPLLYVSAQISTQYLLLPFIIVRFVNFIMIAHVTFITWKITPNFQINHKTFLITLLPALCLLVWYLKA